MVLLEIILSPISLFSFYLLKFCLLIMALVFVFWCYLCVCMYMCAFNVLFGFFLLFFIHFILFLFAFLMWLFVLLNWKAGVALEGRDMERIWKEMGEGKP